MRCLSGFANNGKFLIGRSRFSRDSEPAQEQGTVIRLIRRGPAIGRRSGESAGAVIN
jgi:hypothetical protein